MTNPLSDTIHDLIILGAGPAGITAAIYAARKKLNFFIITNDIGGQAAWSGDIENYTGYQFVTGPELTLKFEEHMKAFGIPVHMPERVVRLEKDGALVRVDTDKATYRSRTVIAATGKRSRELGVEGEQKFKNRGVTYCATCDGPLFKGKAVAIIGGGNSALDAALQLMKIAPRVYMVNSAPQLTGDAVMIQKVTAAENVEVVNGARVRVIHGEKFVTAIDVERGGQLSRLDVRGVFVEIGLIPNAEYAPALKKNELQEIIVDCHNRTNLEGIFAAGDVTTVPEKQIIIACGEGSKACLSAFRYLSTHE